MKYSFLKEIVSQEAHQRKLDAGYGGRYDDGGCQQLLDRLEEYQKGMVVRLDLRPSEFSQLNNVEVGEPKEFSDVIDAYKIKLARNIKL